MAATTTVTQTQTQDETPVLRLRPVDDAALAEVSPLLPFPNDKHRAHGPLNRSLTSSASA